MRPIHRVLLFTLLASLTWPAQSPAQRPISDIYILRSAEQLQSPHIVTYRVLEWTETRGRWIFPDVGYYDSGYGKDQIWFTGAGLDLVHTRRFDWSQEIYFSQEAGPQSTNKRALWLWPVVDAQLTTRLHAQIAAYPVLPLDAAESFGVEVDRAKLEWAFHSNWLAGAGYSGGKCDTPSWQNNPFLTVTRKTHAGNFELWLQRIDSGAQAQVRYLLVKDRE